MSRSQLQRLSTLLAARTVRVLPAAGKARRLVELGPGCYLRRAGEVDVAIVASRASLPAGAGTVLMLEGAAPGRRHRLSSGTGVDSPLVLGPGGGIWSSRLRAGIRGAGRPSDGSGWLVLSQGCGVSEQVLRAAAARALPVRAAVATGGSSPGLLRLAQLAIQLDPTPGLLLCLHRPVAFADLLNLALARPRAVLLVTDSAERLLQFPGPPRLPAPSASQLARSLGLAVTRSPEELAAAAALLDAGLHPRRRLVLGMAPRLDEAALLADRLGRAGLRHAGGAPVAVVVRAARRVGKRAAAPAVDAVVSIEGTGALPMVYPAGTAPRGIPADLETLRALTALLQPAEPPRPVPPSSRTSPAARRAGLLLDGWNAELTEVQVKQLLSLYGLRSPEERLTTSASAAAMAAASMGFPVAVKAVGPGLRERSRRGAVCLDRLGAASVRQAFRDVLDACAALPLTGVLVSRMVPLPFALEVGLIWPTGVPPLLLGRRRREEDEVLGLACPISQPHAEWAAARLLDGGGDASARRCLADWLRRLGALAPDLQGRLRWLHLDTVSPPGKNAPPLILDGEALQTASLRDPLGIRGGEPLAPRPARPR